MQNPRFILCKISNVGIFVTVYDWEFSQPVQLTWQTYNELPVWVIKMTFTMSVTVQIMIIMNQLQMR